MAERNFFNSKLSVQLSILIGRHLPPKSGKKFAELVGSTLGRIRTLETNRAIRTNQNFISGMQNNRAELAARNIEVLTHAGQCLYDLYHCYSNPGTLEKIVPLTETMRDFIKQSRSGQGYVVVAPHLSNFDLVVSRLVQGGFQGKVLSYANPGSGYQLQNKIRTSFGMQVTPLGDSSLEGEVIEYLKAGGVVATGVDRPLPGRKKKHYVRFFGRLAPLPVGYITTALAADVPIIAVTAIMEQDGTYGFRKSPPIHLEPHPNKLQEILMNAERVLQEIEKFIRLAPQQWLMYYPVWPDLEESHI